MQDPPPADAPAPGPPPRPYGVQALRLIGVCFLLGLPLLLAFGLGVLVWAYGLIGGAVLAGIGLWRDPRKLPALLALALLCAIAAAVVARRW